MGGLNDIVKADTLSQHTDSTGLFATFCPRLNALIIVDKQPNAGMNITCAMGQTEANQSQPAHSRSQLGIILGNSPSVTSPMILVTPCPKAQFTVMIANDSGIKLS